MIIVYVADKNYTEYLKQSIKSYRKYNPKAKIVIVSESPMPYGDENVIIPLYKQFRNRGEGDRITNTAYLKLFLTQLPYDKIIYVDADTICQSTLNNLWDMPCEYINICESHNYGKIQAEALGVEKYGCSGMMVMNLDKLRSINFTNKCVEIEMRYPTPSSGWQHDETCINVAMKEKLKFIDKKWDYCHNRTYDEQIKEEEAKILHYIGKDKEDMLRLPFYKDIQPVIDYIKDKRVAIVGNARSLFMDKYGSEIDKNDVIIRFNKGFITQPESQGTNTTVLILGCEINKPEIDRYNAMFTVNRSGHYRNAVEYTISNFDRKLLFDKLGSQPSTGFMAVDLCLTAQAKKISLFGFDWGRTDTFYNPKGYETQHDYFQEEKVILEYERAGLLKINKGVNNAK